MSVSKLLVALLLLPMGAFAQVQNFSHAYITNGSGGAGGGVTGSGASPQVTFWNGTNTLTGDAGLTYNATTDYITLNGGVLATSATGTVSATFVNSGQVSSTLGLFGTLTASTVTSTFVNASAVSTTTALVNGLTVTGLVTATGLNTAATRTGTVCMNTAGTIISASIAGCITSAPEMKNRIKPLESVTERLMKLDAVRFRFNLDTGIDGDHIGFISHDAKGYTGVESVFPELVVYGGDYHGKPIKSVNYQQFTAVLLKGFQEQQRELEALRKIIGLPPRATLLEKPWWKVW